MRKCQFNGVDNYKDSCEYTAETILKENLKFFNTLVTKVLK